MSSFLSFLIFLIFFDSIILLFVVIPIIILAAAFSPLYCKAHKYIITNKRIILFRKFITISRRDIWFDRITDLLVIQGPFGRWKKYGDLQPITSGMEAGMVQLFGSILGIKDPYENKKKIMKVIQKNKQ
ncbi:MAG: PH domain-containing protein [Candidatus Helarchaeales archaeon]